MSTPITEARAVASAVAALTCTHHNDQQRASCPVCLVTALTAQRDELRAEVGTEKNLHAQTRMVVEELNALCTDLKNAGGPPFIRSKAIRLLREDQAALRAEVERTDAIYQRACEVEHELRAELAAERKKAERYRLASLKLEAELAAERARLDWLLLDNLTRLDNSISHRTAIDAAMQEGAT